MQISQQHIIFDFDRTIATLKIDWQFWHKAALQLITKYEPGFDIQTKLDMSSIHVFIAKYGQAFRDEFVKMETLIETEHYGGFEVHPKSLALLEQLHQQQKSLYLLTSNSSEIILPILDELMITGYFKKVITVGDVTNIKPSIAPFEVIYDGSPKDDYLMIGDSASDQGFAGNVGIQYLDVQDI